MRMVIESASNCWEVDRRTNDHPLKPFCVVILRNRKAGRSVVKAASSDFESMAAYAESLQQDIERLTNVEFINKYDLTSAT